MPVSVFAVALLFQLSAISFMGFAVLAFTGSNSTETEAMWFVGGLMAAYGLAAQSVVIGLFKRRSWARTAVLVLLALLCLAAVVEMIVWLIGNLAGWPWIDRHFYRPIDLVWIAFAILGFWLMTRPLALEWFDPEVDFTPEPVPEEKRKPRPPTQIVGLACASCDDRIGAEFEAEFCSECAAPMHQACRIASAGQCAKCRHVERPAQFRSPKPKVRPKWQRQDRPRMNRPLHGSTCIGCGDVIDQIRDSVLCAVCGNPVHLRCKRSPPDADCCSACGYRLFV